MLFLLLLLLLVFLLLDHRTVVTLLDQCTTSFRRVVAFFRSSTKRLVSLPARGQSFYLHNRVFERDSRTKASRL